MKDVIPAQQQPNYRGVRHVNLDGREYRITCGNVYRREGAKWRGVGGELRKRVMDAEKVQP